MKKIDITRTDLKSDFLKQTVIRIDYDYIFDNQIQNVSENLDSFLGEKGYSINNKTLAQFGFKVDFQKLTEDVESSLIDNINVENDQREKYFSFSNDEQKIRIDITQKFSALTVNYVDHIHFDDIKIIFDKVVEELKKERVHLSVNRIGLRKINIFIIEDLNNINKYFENDVFDFSSNGLKNVKIVGKNSIETFEYEDYKVNQTSNVSGGILTIDNVDKNVYQLALDYDIYVEHPENDEIKLEDMNNKLFELYKNSLKTSFLTKLKENNFKEEGIFKI